jgi:hypothetical protein
MQIPRLGGSVLDANQQPSLLVNTEVEWRKVVAKAKIQHDKGEPIEDISMEAIDPEFKFLLSQRPRLIEQELGCHDCVRFRQQQSSDSQK